MSEIKEINITEALENKIDRSKWVKWKFSDLVENIVEKVTPKDSGLDHYIGLEHLDSGSLKIRRFGETSSLIGDKLKIYKGDLIFAKRNSYLKRVAIAGFDAVASAHSMVLRPKSENVNPDFLPFFMMSEVFWKRAIEISVGSLSPTINWKVIAKQEFLLPPKDQQAELAEMLWAMDEVIERETDLKKTLLSGFQSFSKKYFKTEVDEFVPLSEYSEVIMGQSPPGDSYNQEGEGTPLINGPTEFTNRYPIKIQWTTKPSKFCQDKDILLCVRGSTTGRINIANDHYCIGRGVAAIRGKSDIKTDFLEFVLRYNVDEIMRVASGSTFPNIDSKTLKAINVPKVDISIQNQIIEKLKKLDQGKETCEMKISSSQSLQKSIINQIF